MSEGQHTGFVQNVGWVKLSSSGKAVMVYTDGEAYIIAVSALRRLVKHEIKAIPLNKIRKVEQQSEPFDPEPEQDDF